MKFTVHKGEFFSEITKGEHHVAVVRQEYAQLLAAAPEMLDALRQAVTTLPEGKTKDECLRAMAIARG